MGVRRNLYCLRGAAVAAKGRGRGARTTEVVCDWVGWHARGAVAGGGGVVAVCAARWKDIPAEEHDHLSGLLLDRGDPGRSGAHAAMADSNAGVVGTGPHER